MTRNYRLFLVLALLAASPQLEAQQIEVLGTRALGLAGAFVGVADDATAVYWNPAGLATGPFFDLVVERVEGDAFPDGRDLPLDSATRGSGGAAWTMALTTPAFGLSYYRIRAVSFPAGTAETAPIDRETVRSGEVAVSSLMTRHFGATLVQSIGPGVAVGTTLKLVRATAVRQQVAAATAPDALDVASEFTGDTETRFDLDAGLLVSVGAWRVGVVGRNLRQPEFEVSTDGSVAADPMRLTRQVRAGLAFAPRSSLAGSNGPMTVALDLDLEPVDTVYGRRREMAAGAEAWWFGGRAGLRGGVRLNTLMRDAAHRDPAYAVGFSLSPQLGALVEGQITFSRNELEKGWGISTRLTF